MHPSYKAQEISPSAFLRFSSNRNETGTCNLERFPSEKFLPSCKVWWCYNLSLLSRIIDRVDSSRNHWFLIAQTQKIDILQVLVSDKDLCDRSGKPSALLSLIPSTYYHYFYTLLIPWRFLNFLTPYSSAHGPPFPTCLQMSLENVIIVTNIIVLSTNIID